MTLTDFLLARIGEDEAWADHLWFEGDCIRWLAECAAKRAIVAAHTLTTNGWEGAIAKAACRTCVEFHADMDCENQTWPCPTMRNLAAVYADHPDYSDVWRP